MKFRIILFILIFLFSQFLVFGDSINAVVAGYLNMSPTKLVRVDMKKAILREGKNEIVQYANDSWRLTVWKETGHIFTKLNGTTFDLSKVNLEPQREVQEMNIDFFLFNFFRSKERNYLLMTNEIPMNNMSIIIYDVTDPSKIEAWYFSSLDWTSNYLPLLFTSETSGVTLGLVHRNRFSVKYSYWTGKECFGVDLFDILTSGPIPRKRAGKLVRILVAIEGVSNGEPSFRIVQWNQN